MMSIHVLGAGQGYKYLTSQVAAHDVGPELGETLSGYYSRTGNPPGRWLGSGAAHLGVEGHVSEAQMANLYGLGHHPETGEQLGRRYRVYKTVEERIDSALASEPDATPDRVAEITEAVTKVGQRQAAAGYDCTFSPVKSVSVLWAIADDDVSQALEQAHQAAVAETVDWIEGEVARTRAGADGVEYRSVQGVTVAAFDHRTSRAGDPQLHTHAVISNKVLDVQGNWMSLDGQAMFKATVAASEHYNTLLEQHITEALPVRFVEADRGIREIDGIDKGLISDLSKRGHDLLRRYDELTVRYTDRHGRQPDLAEQLKLRQQATLETRPRKGTETSFDDLQDRSRSQAKRTTGKDWRTIQTDVLEGAARTEVAPVDVTDDQIKWLRDDVMAEVMERRSTWTVRHVQAEVDRQVRKGLAERVDPDDPQPPGPRRVIRRPGAVRTAVTAQVMAASISLEAPELVEVPEELRFRGGGTIWRPAVDGRFTSQAILDAEAHLLDAHRSTSGPALDPTHVDQVLTGPEGASLSVDQAAAIERVATSGRPVDLILGPAGAGKTTTLRTLIATYEQAGYKVTGLASSASAAKVLGAECDIRTENTAKWRQVHRDHPGEGLDAFKAGQLVIVDEAGMAGTLTLDELATSANQAGAKVLLVGDHRQLGAVEAGGALRLIHAEGTGAELYQLHRFSQDWEANATLAIRDADPTVATTYDTQGRLHSGLRPIMANKVLAAWQSDVDAGKTSLMIAGRNHDVAALSAKARQHLIDTGHIRARKHVDLHDGNQASKGDLVVTRRNDRETRFHNNKDWVKNGDLWNITKRHRDGRLDIRHVEHGANVTLEADYVATHVELGYAATIHRAQGTTVDTAHVLVDEATSSDSLYVAMSRGRHANHAYLVDTGVEVEAEHQAPASSTAGELFAQAVGRTSSEQSSHEAMADSFTNESSVATLAARYRHTLDTIAAQAPPAIEILNPGDQGAGDTPQWPRIEATITRLRETGLTDPEIHDRIYDRGPINQADSPATLVAWRLAQHDAPQQPTVATPPTSGPPELVEYANQLHDTLRTQLAALPQWEPDPDLHLPDDVAGDIGAYRHITGWGGTTPIGPLPDNHQHRPAWRTLHRELARTGAGSTDAGVPADVQSVLDRIASRLAEPAPTPAPKPGPTRAERLDDYGPSPSAPGPTHDIGPDLGM